MTLILSGTSGLSDVDGSAATPAIRGTDANTGIFFPAADTIAFSEGGAEAMRIDSSGNVGIGTSSPTSFGASSTTIDVSAIAGKSAQIIVHGNGTSGGSAGLYIQQDSVSNAYLWNASNTFTAFATNNTERMRIDSSGNLLVGTTNASLTTGSGIKFFYDATSPYTGQVITATTSSYTTHHIYSTGAGAYRFYVNGAGTVFATSTTISSLSDARFKENIRDLDDGLEKVMALQPRKFDWKEGKGQNIKDARGFVAQEFETVFPDMIDEWKDPAPEGEEPYKSVNANLIPTLTKAIQEQQAIITQLQADVAALKAQP